MKSFEYGDQEVGAKEITVAVASMILGLAIISLPRTLADKTNASDGWISILLGGGAVCLFTYVAAKLASRFPGQTFLQYTARIVPKPLAYFLTFSFGVYALMFAAYEMRGLGSIANIYLFSRTPLEVISLVFLLVVVYAVSGSRVAILRLNLMFFPIVLIVSVIVVLMNIGLFEFQNLPPFLVTDWEGILSGSRETVYSFLGFEIVLFYVMYMNRPKDAPKASLIGVAIVIPMYLFIYIFCIGVFGNAVTQTVIFPTIELARAVEVPGEFFERFESVFFTIWVMTIFNTATMAYDVALMMFRSIFKKGKKIVYLTILSPMIYLIGMYPPNLLDFFRFGYVLSYIGIGLAIVIPTLLLFIAVIRGVKVDG